MNVEILVAKQTAKDATQIETMTKVSATDYNLTPSVSKTESEALGSGNWTKESFVSGIDSGGNIPLEYSRSQMALALEMGGFKKSTVGETTVYTSDTGVNEWYTVGLNDVENGIFEYFKNCKLSTFSIEASLESYIKGDLQIIGMDSTIQNTAYTGTTQTITDEGLVCLGMTFKESGTDKTSTIESVSVNFDNKLEGKRAINSLHYKAIRQNGIRSLGLNITFNEFDKQGYIDTFNSLKTNGKYEVELIFAEMSNPSKRITFIFPNCTPSSLERTDLAGAGGMTKELTALYDEAIQSPVKVILEG